MQAGESDAKLCPETAPRCCCIGVSKRPPLAGLHRPRIRCFRPCHFPLDEPESGGGRDTPNVAGVLNVAYGADTV